MLTLIAIDDDAASLELLESALSQDGLELLTTTDPVAGLELVLRKRPHIVLLDMMMPQLDGMQVLERIVEADPAIEVVLLTGVDSTQAAVEAIRKGAADYLTKPLRIDALRERIARLLADAQRRERALVLDHEMVQTVEFHGMIGRSPAMLDIFSRIRRVAPHFRNLLITGPTGTGKELVARALHQLSRGAAARFVTCNCSAIVETLMESELFGHVAGAFTGATRDKAGLFEYANQGTLFLDEIGEMPLATQAKLLRVLQHQEVQPVGSPGVRKIDVRVIAATHRDLAAMVAAREFREDLYYRLATVEVLIPRLADRIEDLPLLVRYFIERFAVEYSKPVRGLTRRAQTLLSRYAWPGNVRELENVLGNACIMTDGELIDVADLPERVREPVALAGPGDGTGEQLLSLAELERRHVATVLAAVGGNKVQAAEVLGVSRATLYRLLSAINGSAQAPARSPEKSHLPEVR